MTTADIEALAASWAGGIGTRALARRGTVATCLPACDLSTRASRWRPARDLLDAGVQMALASNCNPGTSYTSSMAFCVTTAVLQMRLSVHEAVRAATYGGALALGREAGNDVDGERAVGFGRRRPPCGPAPAERPLGHAPGLPAGHAADPRRLAGGRPRPLTSVRAAAG